MPVHRALLNILAVAWLVFGAAGPVSAAEGHPLCPICQKANDQAASYQEKAGNTLLRGALNTAFGWTEMIRLPAKEAKQGGNPFIGVANGIGHGIGRTFSGLAEIATFWAPKVRGQYLHLSDDCPLDTNK